MGVKYMITVTINGEKRDFPKEITFETIAKEYQNNFDAPIFIAIENGKIRELAKTAKKNNAEISFLTMRDKIGHSTYVRSASLLLVKAVSDVIGDIQKGKIKIEFAIGQGYYCSVRGDFSVTEEFIEKVKVRMQELVDANLPITKQAYNIDKARELLPTKEQKNIIDAVQWEKDRIRLQESIYKKLHIEFSGSDVKLSINNQSLTETLSMDETELKSLLSRLPFKEIERLFNTIPQKIIPNIKYRDSKAFFDTYVSFYRNVDKYIKNIECIEETMDKKQREDRQEILKKYEER